MAKQERENAFDLLRVVACVAVVAIHVGAPYVKAVYDEETLGHLFSLQSPACVAALAINIFTRFAVPCFVMLAGAFALANERNADYRYYYRKTFFNVVVHTINFSAFYFALGVGLSLANVLTTGGDLSDFNVWPHLLSLLTGNQGYHMWYLYMSFGLYLCAPIIIRWKKELDSKLFAKIVVAISIVTILGGSLSGERFLNWDFSYSTSFLGYFLLGYVIRDKYKSKKSNRSGVAFIGLALLAGSVIFAIQYWLLSQGLVTKYEGRQSLVFGPLSPLVAIFSVLLFIGFSKLNIKKDFGKTAQKTFFIYLTHIFVMRFTIKLVFYFSEDWCWLTIPAGVLATFVFSYFLSIFYEKVWNVVDRKFAVSERLVKTFGLGGASPKAA